MWASGPYFKQWYPRVQADLEVLIGSSPARRWASTGCLVKKLRFAGLLT